MSSKTKSEERLSLGLLTYLLSILGYPVDVNFETDCQGKPGEGINEHRKKEAWTAQDGGNKVTPSPKGKIETHVNTGVNVQSVTDCEQAVEAAGSEHRSLTSVGTKANNPGRKSNVKQVILFAIIAISQAVFSVRTLMSVWFISEQKMTAATIAFISYTLCWVQVLYTYSFHYPTIKKHLPDLLFKIRSYEKKYGFSFDVPKANRLMKAMVLFIKIAQPTTIFVYVTLLIVYVPEFRKQLFPFHEAEGWALAAAVLLIDLCMIVFLECSSASMFTPFAVATLARREFLFIANEFEKLFNKETLPDKQPESRLQTLELDTTDQEAITQSPSLNIGNNGSKQLTDLEMTIQVLGVRLYEEPHARSENTCVATATDDKLVSMETTFNHLRGHQTSVTGNVSCCQHRVASSTRTTVTPATEGRHIDVSLETTFDDLRRRHECVCGIVSCCQQCFPHVIPATYTFGITIICFIIFSVSSGYIGSGDLPGLTNAFTTSVSNIILGTIFACALNDSAKAILQPLYRADCSQFTPRLIQKIQYLNARLTTDEVGFHVYGMFHVNRSTFLMLGGTILTYAVVVVQFNMTTTITVPCENNSTNYLNCSSCFNVTDNIST